MNYTDAYLKFASEAEANSVLYRIEGAVEADPEQGIEAVAGTQVPNYQNIDVLGIIYNNDAVIDADGNLVTAATPKAGWHVNVRALEGEDTTAIDPFSIKPTNPRRIWG